MRYSLFDSSKNHLSDVIRSNNKFAEMSDAFRLVNAEDGYTWKHGIIYSRLDYIFVSNSVISKISGACIDWDFEWLGHASVKIDFIFKKEHIFKKEPKRDHGFV